MAVKIVLKNSSQSFNDDYTSARDPEIIRMSRIVYQNLGSLVKNKTIVKNADYQNEFEKIMYLMDENNITADSTLEAIDEYLGSLGITETYPYEKDYNNIPAWADISGESPERNVVHLDDNKVKLSDLVDESGNKLVYYTQL